LGAGNKPFTKTKESDISKVTTDFLQYTLLWLNLKIANDDNKFCILVFQRNAKEKKSRLFNTSLAVDNTFGNIFF